MRRDSQISLPPADACNAYPRVTGQGLKFLFGLYNLLYFFQSFKCCDKIGFLMVHCWCSFYRAIG